MSGRVGEGASEGLSNQLEGMAERDAYRIDEVLKESPFETTQLVSLVGADGAVYRRYVRKLIARESGIGAAYELVFASQGEGHRFKYIPTIVECYVRDDKLVVVMEYVAGETLEERVARQGASESLAHCVFPKLCDAVTELHEEFRPPLVHRDLKPSNIVLSGDSLVIVDFGIARVYREEARSDTVKFGTLSFAPPEQFGFGQTSVRSDVYALGMVLYYCLVGAVPDTYVAERDLAVAKLPSGMRSVIGKATSLDPSKRQASVRELKEDFLAASKANRTVFPTSSVSTDSRILEKVPREKSDSNRSEHSGVNQPGFTSGRFSMLGKVWNILVGAVLAFLLISCINVYQNPGSSLAGYSTSARGLVLLVLMPLFFSSAAWMLFDKRRVTQRFPRLERFRFWHWLLLCVVAFLLLFCGVGLTMPSST